MRVPECHPERPHQGKGMCGPCYFKAYDAARAAKRNANRRKDPSEYAENYRKPPTQPARVPDCHPDRKHAAHGLCGACYQAQSSALAICHPDRRLKAGGLCEACYDKRRYNLDPETARRVARERQLISRKLLRDQLLEAYGGKCACPKCPETNSAFLTLEHLNGDGKAHRKAMGSHSYADLRRRGFPQEGYTLLCWNCNAGSRFTGVCPHMES